MATTTYELEGDTMTYESWMREVSDELDRLLVERPAGVMRDARWRHLYEEGMDPYEAAELAYESIAI